jgi:hypothetical protein
MPKAAHLDPARHQNLLFICRLQSLPVYREILRRLTQGQAVRPLSLWLARQPLDGPCGTWTYWQKLLNSAKSPPRKLPPKPREFDVVDRNLLRSASMKVIHRIQEETGGK